MFTNKMTVYTLSERVYDSPNDRAIVVSARAQGVVNPCDAPDEKNIINGLCADTLAELVDVLYANGYRLHKREDRVTSIPSGVRCVGFHTDYPIRDSMLQQFEIEFEKKEKAD